MRKNFNIRYILTKFLKFKCYKKQKSKIKKNSEAFHRTDKRKVKQKKIPVIHRKIMNILLQLSTTFICELAYLFQVKIRPFLS